MLNNLKKKLLKKLESNVLNYLILNAILINFSITFILFCFVCNSTVLFKLLWLFFLIIIITFVLIELEVIVFYDKKCEIIFNDESNLYNDFYKLSNYFNNRFVKVLILVSPFFCTLYYIFILNNQYQWIYLNISWFLFAFQYLHFIFKFNKNKLQNQNNPSESISIIIEPSIDQPNYIKKETIEKPISKIADIEKDLELPNTPEFEKATIEKPINKIADIEKDLELPNTPEFEKATIENPINKIADIVKDLKLPNTPENANEIGLAGELYVLNYEKKILKDNNKIDLAEKVRHISIEIGDGAGYDILSYEFNGDTKFIEVKTTQSNTKQFIITLNEKSKMFGETNYYLYHLTNFNMDTKKGNIKMIKKGELIKEEVLEYVISPKN